MRYKTEEEEWGSDGGKGKRFKGDEGGGGCNGWGLRDV